MATRIPTMHGRYYVLTLVWRGREYDITVFRSKLQRLQRPQAQKIANKVYPGSRVVRFHESDPTEGPVILASEAYKKAIKKKKSPTKSGTEELANPATDTGTASMGAFNSYGEEASLAQAKRNIGRDPKKKTCWTGYKAKGTKMKDGRAVPNCVKEDEMSEQHYGAQVNKIPKELDAAVKMHASQSKRLKNSKEFKKDAGKEANKIPAELDKAVAMHKSQAKRLRAAAVKEEAPKGAKYDRMIKHIKKSYSKDGNLTKGEEGIAYATAWKHKNKKEEVELEHWSKGGSNRQKYQKGYKNKDPEVAAEETKKCPEGTKWCPECQKCKEVTCAEKHKMKSEDWQRKSGKSDSGGLNEKGRKSYERQNPGSDLKAPVTGKVKKGGKAAGRRKSFCSRMRGMKKKLTSAKTARDPDSRINKALRKWKC